MPPVIRKIKIKTKKWDFGFLRLVIKLMLENIKCTLFSGKVEVNPHY